MKPHGFLVYLPSELYTATVKLQADKGLGRVYPVLYAINKGLFKLGYITREVYATFEQRYSEPLVQKKDKPLTLGELRRKEKIEQLERTFSGVLEQWPRLRKKSRQLHIRKAKEYVNEVSNAELVLALAQGDNESEVTP